MGTHPIFESDFDCLTDRVKPQNSNGTKPNAAQLKVSEE